MTGARPCGARRHKDPGRIKGLAHITGDAEAETYQPMNVNFGLFPPLPEVKKKVRKEAYTERAKADFGEWLASQEAVPA